MYIGQRADDRGARVEVLDDDRRFTGIDKPPQTRPGKNGRKLGESGRGGDEARTRR